MPKPTQLYILRHGQRLDMASPNWIYTTPTPYDPPLTPAGISQCQATGTRISSLLPTIQSTLKRPSHSRTPSSSSTSSDSNSESAISFVDEPLPALPSRAKIIIHTSPFLRCLQTATSLASSLTSNGHTAPLLRVDAWLGEWMTPDYYTDITPPPPISTMCSDAVSSLLNRDVVYADSVHLDHAWPLLSETSIHRGAEMGEEWAGMHKRFRKGLGALLDHYHSSPLEDGETETVVILVTHGAGCNALLGAVSQKPVLIDVGIGALSKANLQPNGNYDLDIVACTTSNFIHPGTHGIHHHRSASYSTGDTTHPPVFAGLSHGLWTGTAHVTPTIVVTGGTEKQCLGMSVVEREREKEREREREHEVEAEREGLENLGFGGWGLDVGSSWSAGGVGSAWNSGWTTPTPAATPVGRKESERTKEPRKPWNLVEAEADKPISFSSVGGLWSAKGLWGLSAAPTPAASSTPTPATTSPAPAPAITATPVSPPLSPKLESKFDKIEWKPAHGMLSWGEAIPSESAVVMTPGTYAAPPILERGGLKRRWTVSRENWLPLLPLE